MNEFPYEAGLEADAKSVARVVELFAKQYDQGLFGAGQLVVRGGGRVLINQALGEGVALTKQQEIAVTPQTLFPVYSAGKPMAALCIALLQQRRMIDLNAPVAHYLPEFGQADKAAITVDDVLTHRAGVVIPELWDEVMAGRDEEALWARICNTVPRYPLGTFAYMPGEYGWILARLVQCLDGRSLASFFAQELVAPLGLSEMHYGLAERSPEEVAMHRWLGKPVEMVAGANAADYFEEAQTSLRLFESMNPAICMVSNAASLAAFYEFLVGGGVTRDGKRLLDEVLLHSYTGKVVAGWNKSLSTYLAIGRGFMVGSLLPSSFGWWNSGRCFGHAGVFSVLAFADAATGISAAVVTDGNRSIKDFMGRFIPLAQAIRGIRY